MALSASGAVAVRSSGVQRGVGIADGDDAAFSGHARAAALAAAAGGVDGAARNIHKAADDAAAAGAVLAGGVAAGGLRDGIARNLHNAAAVDAIAAGAIGRSAALRGFDFGAAEDGEGAVTADAVAAALAAAAGGLRDGAAPNFHTAVTADAVAAVAAFAGGVAAGSLLYLAALDGECTVAADAAAAVEDGIALAALRCFDGAALNRDGNILAAAAAADAVATEAALGVYDGAAGDDDIGVGAASSLCAAADAGTTVVIIAPRLAYGADGGDVAACYLNGAGTFAPGAADASSATVACGSQAAGVFAILLFGCDGQFAGANGTAAIIALFIVLEAGMVVAAGQLVVALERDFRVARALDAEGGVVGLAGIDIDIVQRHVEGVVFSGAFIAHELVDDADDVLGRGLEVIRRGLQGRGRFGRGLFVVIGVGDLEGCTGVCELAFGRRAVALRAFRAFGRGGSAAGLGVVFLAAGAAVLRAGGAVRAGAAALRAGGAAVRAFTLRVRASRTGVLAVGGVTGLGLFRGLVLVFLAAAVRRVAALGVAGVDHVFVFVFAVFYFERGRRGFGGRGCRGAAFGRAAAGGAAFGRTGAGVGVFGGVGSCSALDDDIVVLVLFAELVCITCFIRALDIDVAFSVFGDCDVAAVVVNIICTRIRRCGHAGHHCGCQCQRRHPVRRGPGGVCRHPQRMPQNAHCKLAIRDHGNLL